MDLARKTCTPCQGGVPPLTPDEAAAFGRDLPDWEIENQATRIRRRYRFTDFAAAFDFVRECSEIAESEGHHPDICFGWGYADVVLFTHKIKGLHENDFIMAAKFNEAFRRRAEAA